MSTATWRLCALVVAVLSAPLSARAQGTPTGDVARARVLFEQGRELLEQNRTAEACALFSQSEQLAPTIAALLNLGLCERQRGRLATANSYFQRAAQASKQEGDDERAAKALEDAAEVARLAGTLSIRAGSRTSHDTVCRVDGIARPSTEWSAAVPMDSGEHRVEVRRGDRVVMTTVVVVSDGVATVYEIPETTAGDVGSASSVSRLHASPRRPAPEAARPALPAQPSHHVPAVSYVAAGVGLVSLAVGLGFGAAAWAKYSQAEHLCTAVHRCSSNEPLSLYDAAVEDARVADIAAAAGGVALAAGVVFYFVYGGERENAVPVRVSTSWLPGGGSATLRGAF